MVHALACHALSSSPWTTDPLHELTRLSTSLALVTRDTLMAHIAPLTGRGEGNARFWLLGHGQPLATSRSRLRAFRRVARSGPRSGRGLPFITSKVAWFKCSPAEQGQVLNDVWSAVHTSAHDSLLGHEFHGDRRLGASAAGQPARRGGTWCRCLREKRELCSNTQY
jgi:hypothetical protein